MILRVLLEANSDRYIAENKPSGKEIMQAIKAIYKVEETKGSTPYTGFLKVGVHLVAVKYSLKVTAGSLKKLIASVIRVKTIATEIRIAANADIVIKNFTMVSTGFVLTLDKFKFFVIYYFY